MAANQGNASSNGAIEEGACSALSCAFCVPDLFEAQVQRTPQNRAFLCGPVTLTYAELDTAANRMAHALIARGLGPEDIVALLLPRSPELIVSLLGILKAGAAYLPLDMEHPPERLFYMLDDSAASLIITTAAVRDRLQLSGSRRMLVIDDADVQHTMRSMPARRVRDADRLRPLRPDNLLYTIYTSGSTGQPKGVAIEHRSFASLMRVMMPVVPLVPEKILLATISISFDPAGMEIFLALLQGATVAMLSNADSRDPVRVASAAAELNANVMITTPTFLRALLACNLPRTMRLLIGGEPLPSDLVPQLLAFAEAHNQYGPTETTVCASSHRIVPDDAHLGSVVTIGPPLANQRFYIVGEDLTAVAPGASGELCIAGEGLGRGYLNRPKLTAERFVHCPSGEAGERMYRTGDLARWRADGAVEFMGRIDHQVKIRGFRIEPGEIETTCMRLITAMRECAVVPRTVREQTQLVAYYTVFPGSAVPSAYAMRTTLAGTLPDYMVPPIFVRLDTWPLTPNGKLDRNALPQPDPDADRAPYQPPLGPTEVAICRVFAELTTARRVSRDDDFFQLGGNSLTAVLCVHRLQKELGREIALRQFFEAPTPEALAKRLRAETGSIPASGTPDAALPTIFLLPGTGGDGPRLVRFRMEFEDAANLLPLDYPEWSSLVDGQGDREQSRAKSMDVLVQHLLRQIQDAAPSGPIWLLGYSLGGYCAHALAMRLANAGREIAFVGLLDTSAFPPPVLPLSAQMLDVSSPARQGWEMARDILRLLEAIPHKNVTRVLALTIVRRFTSPWARPFLSTAGRMRKVKLPTRFGFHLRYYFNEAIQVDTVRSWHRRASEKPAPLSVPAFLFRAEGAPQDAAGDLGWQRHFSSVQVVEVPGTHDTMFDPPHLKTLCDRARSVLQSLRQPAEQVAS